MCNSGEVNHHVDALKQRHPIDTGCQVFDEHLINRRAQHHRMPNDCNHPVATLDKRWD
jgi:hypothetical protein